jgi:hypothetical protein
MINKIINQDFENYLFVKKKPRHLSNFVAIKSSYEKISLPHRVRGSNKALGTFTTFM